MTIRISRRGLLGGTAAVAIASTLSACSSGATTDPSGTPLKMMAWDFEPDTAQLLVDTWSEKSGTPVTLEVNPLSGYSQALQTRMQSGEVVDLFYNQAPSGKKYFEAEWARALDDLDGADQVLGDMFESARPAYQSIDGQLIALPYYSALHYTIYNKKFLEEAGISSPPTSFDELFSQCEQIRDAGVCKTPYQGFWSKDGIAEWFINYLLNGGVTPFDQSGDPEFADDSKAVDVMTWWREIYASGLAPQSTLTDDPGILTDNLANGHTAFFSAHHYFLQIVKNAAGSHSEHSAAMSSGFGTNPTLQGGEILQMGRIEDATRRNQAWDLMKFYGYKDEEGNLPAFEQWAVAAGQLAPYPAFFENETIRKEMGKTYDLDGLKDVFDRQSDPVPTRFEIWYPEFANQVSPIIEGMLINKDGPKATLDKLAEAARSAKQNA